MSPYFNDRRVSESADEVLAAFEAHLRTARGAVPATCRGYTFFVGEFLRTTFGTRPLDFLEMSADHVISFVAGRAARSSPGTAKLAATALRSFFHYLQMQGLCPEHLIDAIPIVAFWKRSQLPKILNDEQLAAFLRAFDRTTALGRRDYAMALCLAHLGLRAVDVAGLTLDDIDWRHGVVRLGGKPRRVSLLPLPATVGHALVAYLRGGRPATSHRGVFVRHVAPIRPLDRGGVRAAIRRAFDRSGVPVPSKGSHVLRHTAATRMLRSGASLKDLADVLRHRSLDTTLIYAKVDLPRLSQVALPWPGEKA
jgi:site-specific recombinase XerD